MSVALRTFLLAKERRERERERGKFIAAPLSVCYFSFPVREGEKVWCVCGVASH